MAQFGPSDVVGRAVGATARRVSHPHWEDTQLNPLKDLPREGARWYHAPDGWRRWSYLDEEWVPAEMAPPPAVASGAVGTVHVQVDDGTWMEVDAGDPLAD